MASQSTTTLEEPLAVGLQPGPKTKCIIVATQDHTPISSERTKKDTAPKSTERKKPPLSYLLCNKYEGCRIRMPNFNPRLLDRIRKRFWRSNNLATFAKSPYPFVESKFCLDVCQHLSLDQDDLDLQFAQGIVRAYCYHGYHGLIRPLSREHERTEVTLTLGGGGSVIITKHLVLAQFPSDAPSYPPQLLRRRLEQLEQSLCPHVFLDRCGGLEAHVQCAEALQAGGCMCCGGIHRCRDEGCETEWKAYRRKGEEGVDEVVLEVVRKLCGVLDGREGR
ncbi:hypothetical protein BU26DRAFT_564722 [Trematosphaeria pertusa]|uniref:Uncharacterized protein n=1 Tax=Trematosphaeria pertusa TaxID=390896 RepID=A0A6A6IFR9_9PLEO|nr:uncharacterized protein BU26DRAFT_564722 [Trematosphaeria pertusa]KAF2249039.1 hypothetical protein BU26DRAFT_564722 [Trematosphaeria pertusa]